MWIEQYILLFIVLIVSLACCVKYRTKPASQLLFLTSGLFIAVFFIYLFIGRGDIFNVIAFTGRCLGFFAVFGLLFSFIKREPLSHLIAATSVIILISFFYGYHVEPKWLEVREHTVFLPVKEPLKIVVLSDFQTDVMGQYEKRVFDRIAELKPDLLLLTGDYLSVPQFDSRFASLERQFKTHINSLPESLYGAYAVSGDVETRQNWQPVFDGTPVKTFDNKTQKIRSDICLTGLGIYVSRQMKLTLPQCESSSVHIVFGHNPNFALSNIDADLMIAGHTHGGQVQLPYFGPVVTFSEVPNAWADGMTKLSENRTLIVSRGTGMEREYAPRVRFLARPELTVIDVVPKE